MILKCGSPDDDLNLNLMITNLYFWSEHRLTLHFTFITAVGFPCLGFPTFLSFKSIMHQSGIPEFKLTLLVFSPSL